MNANPKGNLAGARAPTETSSLLRRIFRTPKRKQRLRAVLGCKMPEVYKKLAGERNNPLHLAENILLLTIEQDFAEGTNDALEIAEYLLHVYRRSIGKAAQDLCPCDWHKEANRLAREASQAFCQLNSLEADERDLPDLLKAEKEARDLQQKTRAVRSLLQARINQLTNAPPIQRAKENDRRVRTNSSGRISPLRKDSVTCRKITKPPIPIKSRQLSKEG